MERSIFVCVLEGRQLDVESGVRQALEGDVPPESILEDSLIRAMKEVGRRFEEGEYYIPEMLLAARAMKAGLAVLKPHLQADSGRQQGTLLIGTVKGDLHDIGKNLVSMMFEGAGYNVVDLGTDVPPEVFAEAVRSHRPVVVGISALLTTTMQNMKSVIEAIEDVGLRHTVKVIVGGAPVTEEFAREIGADGYAPDASRAVRLAEQLTEETSRV